MLPVSLERACLGNCINDFIIILIYNKSSNKKIKNKNKHIKNIYFEFVRSQLKYASLIWSSNNIGVNHNLEAIQNRFLRFLALNLKSNAYYNQIIMVYYPSSI